MKNNVQCVAGYYLPFNLMPTHKQSCDIACILFECVEFS